VAQVPLTIGSTALVVERALGTRAAIALAHDAPAEVRMAPGDWRWLELDLSCDASDAGEPIAGCTPSAQLQAALEVDAAFDRNALRYHSLHVLLAHAPVRQPVAPASGAALSVDARQCFDGIDEARMASLSAGYLQRRGAEVVEAEANGFTQRTDVDRGTYRIGMNVSSGGCNALPTPKLWLRLRCAAAGLLECVATVRAVLVPVRVPLDMSMC